MADAHRSGQWRWWRHPYGSRDVAAALQSHRKAVATHDDDRRLDLVAMRAVYLDVECTHFDRLGYHRQRASRYPLTRGAVDAVHAQLVTNRPRPKIVTINGDYHAQQRAELRQKWLDGEYERLGAQAKLALFALDLLVYGTGVLKVGVEDGRLVLDRVWCGDIWVDPREARYGRVRTYYQHHAIDRSVLMDRYPDHAEEIENVAGLEPGKDNIFPDLETEALWDSPDLVEVIEVWRLPTSRNPTQTDDDRPPLGSGRRVVVIPGVEEPVEDEEWAYERPPFIFGRWGIDPESFWGVGLVQQAAGMQSDLNELTSVIQQTYLTFVPQLWVSEGAGIDVGALTDLVGAVNTCNPPGGDVRLAMQIVSGDVSPGLLNREATIADRFLPTLGIDVLGAQAEKPAGLNSGEALRNYRDFTSQRHIDPGRRYEHAGAVDLAKLLLWYADQLADAGQAEGLRVWGGKLGLDLIEYEDTRPEREDEVYEVRVKPGSQLPKDISGRIQTILDMQAAGLQMDPVELAELMEMPDTDAMMRRLSAGRDLVRAAIARCSDPDEPQPVAHSFWPREWAASELVTAIQAAENDGADEKTLERLRRLHGTILNMPDPAAPPPGAPPMTPQIPPESGMAPPLAPEQEIPLQ